MDIQSPQKPRRGMRPTTLAIWPEQWDRLLEIERETGVKPSVKAREALQLLLGIPESRSPSPAA